MGKSAWPLVGSQYVSVSYVPSDESSVAVKLYLLSTIRQ